VPTTRTANWSTSNVILYIRWPIRIIVSAGHGQNETEELLTCGSVRANRPAVNDGRILTP
jgi:hypothetical protein